LEPTSRALPVVPLGVARVCVPPRLKTTLMDISRGPLASAGSQKPTRFRIGGLIYHPRLRLKESRQVLRGRMKGRVNGLQADAAFTGSVVLFGTIWVRSITCLCAVGGRIRSPRSF